MPDKWEDLLPKKKDSIDLVEMMHSNNSIDRIIANDVSSLRTGYNMARQEDIKALEKAQTEGKICWVPSKQIIADTIRDNLIFKDLSCDNGRIELAKAILSKLRGDK